MKITVRSLTTIAACAGTLTGVLMVLLGMEPRLVLVGCVVALVATTSWLMYEMGSAVAPLDWYNYGTTTDTSARPDRRVRALRSKLRQPPRRSAQITSNDAGTEPSDEIVDSLLRVIDDHLAAEHGVDRSIGADQATELLGAELARFVSDPTSRRPMTARRSLARTVSLIEDL